MKATDIPGRSGLVMKEPVIFERSTPGRSGASLDLEFPDFDPSTTLPPDYLRDDIPDFPELSEPEVFRHFLRLSQWNYGVDTGMYPLGSCTMKYNPKINEAAARLEGFSQAHPLIPPQRCQGLLALMYHLERYLCTISGFERVSLQPAAGAQGELTALLMARAYFRDRGEERNTILIPDSAHGTNPASSVIAGYKVRSVASGPNGYLEAKTIAEALDDDVAALMVTNPNTLGLFEEEIVQICSLLHQRGGLVYCDGANLNALMGRVLPAALGFDLMHFNLHKTFSTPHGGGGPGSGPVGAVAALAPYLPSPLPEKQDDRYLLDHNRPQSIGRVRSFWGHFGVLVRAYAYIRELGAAGLGAVTDLAVLNANYLRVALEETFHLPYPGTCMHEVVFSDKRQNERGIKTLDIAKRLIDYGFHPPTVYFPLIVQGALMIEPTESESRETLDAFVAALQAISAEDPQLLHEAPQKAKARRLDEATAARKPILRWTPDTPTYCKE